jgi:polar amino acid transport system substrate-binding protein
LKQNRVDIVIAERWQGLRQARKLGLPAIAQEPPLRTTDMYIYMNKRHADTVPRLAAAMQQMKKDGSYQRWLESTLGSE